MKDLGRTAGEARLMVAVAGRSWLLRVIGLDPCDDSAANMPPAPYAVILVSEPEADIQRNVEAVGRVDGLTMAEQRLLGLICDGHGTVAAARHLGVATTTVRTHLQRIFSKTGTSRQSELVRYVMSHVAIPH